MRTFLYLLGPVLLLVVPFVTRTAAGEEDVADISVPRAFELADDARPAIVRIEWRRGRAPRDLIERHAVVVDSEGWLLMAGPRPSPDGTLAALFEDGRAMRAQVWASDAQTCLTLLRVPASQLPPLALRPTEKPAPAESRQAGALTGPAGTSLQPPRLAPGLPIVMVTAEGQLARGHVRGNHRRRIVADPDRGRTLKVTCLDEAALSVISTDLGAPWLDAKGRLAGLLVGADVGSPIPGGASRLRPEVTAAYAVPSEVIRVVWPLLKVRRHVPRGALGAYVRQLSRAARTHVCPGCGAYEIRDVTDDGAAARAGIRAQDILRYVEGLPLAPSADLPDILLPYRPGTRVRLGLLRRGKLVELTVLLDRAPE